MLHIAICDDEKAICEKIRESIIEYKRTCPEDISIGIFNNGEDLYERLEKGQFYDLIFLDIELYQLNGIEIGAFIRNSLDNQLSQIVYISSQQKYAMDLFALRPLDFLLKPIKDSQVVSCIEMTKKMKQGTLKYFTYQVAGVNKKVSLFDIYSFESNARKIKLVYIGGTDEFYGKIDEIYENIREYPFLHIHKSYLVNYSKIKSIKPTELILDNGDKLPVSRSKRKEIMSRVMEVKMGSELK